MEKFDDVDYSEYKYKSYIWHENYREDLPKKRGRVTSYNSKKREENIGRSEKKKRIVRMDKEGAFVVIMIIICFSITFFLAEFMGSDGTLKFLNSEEKYFNKYYALAVDSFDEMSLASVSADEIINLGCAGYIIHLDKYYLIASIYADKSDAESIQKRISGYNGSVVEIIIKEPTLSWCKTADKTIVLEVLEYVNIAFNSLYITVNSLDNNNISESVANAQIKSLYNEINTLSSKLENISISKSKEEVVKISSEIEATKAILKNVYEGGYEGNLLLSAIRFSMVSIISGGKNLIESI